MIFNSIHYIVFLIAVVLVYWHLPRRPRLIFLFAASLIFYGFWDARFIPVLLISVLVDYIAARCIEKSTRPIHRKAWLFFSLGSNLGILVFFKYLYFFAETLSPLARGLGLGEFSVTWSIVLPLGISFYTFQSMSYSIDVYRRKIKAVSDPLLVAVYVLYFPQLVAGPILRAGEVFWQLDRRPTFNISDIRLGIWRILFGLFLKVCLADYIGHYVDAGFAAAPITLSAWDVIVLAFLFGFQIYFDFAAYSHIALGTARLMGIVFPENFDFPYMARNPKAFWQTWHISLSSWVRDYIYLPLIKQRVSDSGSGGGLSAAVEEKAQDKNVAPWKSLALFLTWAVMGLWHGAAWTFVAWGLWNAAIIQLYRWLVARPFWIPPAAIGWGMTLLPIMLGWIWFRAESLAQALGMYGHLVTLSSWYNGSIGGGLAAKLGISLDRDSYYIALIILLAMILIWLVDKKLVPKLRQHRIVFACCETVLAAILFGLVMIFLRPIQNFIYFQF